MLGAAITAGYLEGEAARRSQPLQLQHEFSLHISLAATALAGKFVATEVLKKIPIIHAPACAFRYVSP